MEIQQSTKDTIKGILFMLAGISLLFYTLGILQAILKYVLIALSVTLIVYGFFKARIIQVISDLVQRR